ncbi:MAG: class D beta-lactamase [Bacteroidetes bacterium]|nr:class D beta-lactamase [Bacteroidota bacterium]
MTVKEKKYCRIILKHSIRTTQQRKLQIILLSLLFLLPGCGPKEINIRDDFEKYFKNNGYTGSFMLYDLKNNSKVYFDRDRCSKGYPPGETYNIFLSLVALETGVAKDENLIIRWDRKKRKYPVWNQDHTLESALKNSVDWYFEELARRIGLKPLKKYIRKSGYGNKKVGNQVDNFWMDGSIRISQEDQIDFLEDLYANNLPFSDKTQKTVKRILIKETTEEYTFSAKTGMVDKYGIGWYIGYIERDDNVYFFATNIFGPPYHKRFHFARIRITHRILKDLDLI